MAEDLSLPPLLRHERISSIVELIDQKIEYHQNMAFNLKIKRNSLAPISRIPPEVLCNIFFFVSRDALGKGLDWINLTYVCRGWRDLALSSPFLWSNPPFQSPAWTKEMLVRSAPVTLTIDAECSLFDDPTKRYFASFDAFQTHYPRIKCIDIEFPSHTTDWLQHLPRSAPNLESLTLHRRPPWENDDVPAILEQGHLRDSVHLQRLDLSGMSIDWSSHLPASLTSLKLGHIHHSSFPAIRRVWDALRRMPLLETLELSHALPVSGHQIIANRVVHLGRLRDLKLETGIAETECFLKTVTFPSNAVVSIKCHQFRLGYVNLAEIIESLGRVANNRPSHIESLQIYFKHYVRGEDHDSRMLEIRVPRPSTGQDPRYPSFGFRAGWDQYDEGEQMIVQLFRHFPFNFVSHLVLESVYEISFATVLLTAGSLPLLQTLKTNIGPSVLAVLRSNLPVSDNMAIPCISFPSLQSLVIIGAKFMRSRQCSWGEVNIKDLVACLAWRKQHGKDIQQLYLEACYNVNDDKLTRLRKVVAEVKSDGVRRTWIEPWQ